MKKILIISQHFWPESFKINDLALELQERGFTVTVLTGKPNYPSGNFYNGYGFFKKPVEYFNGIKVYRVPLIPRGNGGKVSLVLNYFSFVLFSSLFICFHWKRYHSTFTFASSPIIQAYPALLHKLFFKSKSAVWLLDLWPESVVAAGGIRNRFILSIVGFLSGIVYRFCDILFVQSEAFIPVLKQKKVAEGKLFYIPNWAESLFVAETPEQSIMDSSILPFNPGKDFIIMSAGNIGEAQGVDEIIEAAFLIKDYSHIKWVFVGEGRRKESIVRKVEELCINETVMFLGGYPLETMPWFYHKADIMLLSLKDEYIFSLTVPARLQSFLASGKPIIGFINGESASIINQAKCGFVCQAGNSRQLADAVIRAAELSSEELLHMGENGRRFYRLFFEKNSVINKICEHI